MKNTPHTQTAPRKGAIYFSLINQLAVRVVRIDPVWKVALVKHHDKDIFQEEVDFCDLVIASKQRVKNYLKPISA